MRAFSGAFSLVGVLVVLCIIMVIWRKYEYPVLKTGAQLQPIAQQISGHDENGQDASHSITYDPDYKGNQLKGLIVKTIVPGGAMEKHFGLVVGDEIVQIGQEDMAIYNNDSDLAAASVLQDGFEKGEALQVKRNGNIIILPKGANPDGSSDIGSQLSHIRVPSP
jgi:PDZ domain